MAINLQKGQKISLSKESAGLDRIIVGLGWDAASPKRGGLFSRKPAEIDCDASAFLLKDGHFVNNKDLVYFGNLRHSSQAVLHMGDNLTGDGDGDDEQIVIELNKVPAEYDRIAIVVNIYQAVKNNQHFGMISNAFCRVVDARNNAEICRYNLTEDYSNMYAMIFGEVYRHNNEWKFNAIGQGTQDTSLGDMSKRYL